MNEPDELFFHRFPQRQYRIRLPFGKESESEFQTLGPHDTERRRIIAWKVPTNIRAPYVTWASKVVRVPFLAFSDEEIADNDEILGPILNDIMTNAAADHGMFT